MSEPGVVEATVAQPPGPPAVRLPVAVLAVVASVVVALLAVALVVRLDADRLPTGPPRDPPAAAPDAATFVVDADRVARFQEFSVTLAGAPYECDPAQTAPAGFDAYAGCSHVVHTDFDPQGHDWSALTGVLLVDESLVNSGDLEATTTTVFNTLVTTFFDANDHYSLSKISKDGLTVSVPAGRSASRLGNVNVKKKGLPTPYDRLVVVVVQLGSGRCVAFFSDFPHDGGQDALQAVSTSLSTVSLQR